MDERCRESAEELLRSIERGERDVGEGKDECLEMRLRISLSIEDKTGESHCKQRMESRCFSGSMVSRAGAVDGGQHGDGVGDPL